MTSIFINDLTVIDHAVLKHDGSIEGGSFLASFIISGPTTEDEQVVADFSSVKKQIKALIDHPLTGLDHKLWLCYDSNVTNIIDGAVFYEVWDNQFRLKTKKGLVINAPVDCHVLMDIPSSQTEEQPLEYYISKMLEHGLAHHYGLFDIKVKTILSRETRYPKVDGKKATCSFRYTHGLAKSSSWGCQNIMHGHNSFILLSGNDQANEMLLVDLTHKIAHHLHDGYLVNHDYIYNGYNIGYESLSRGHMSMYCPDQKLILLNNEPTIENIGQYVMDKFSQELVDASVSSFYISEGPTKGCLVQVQ